jgi:hypothetical protein
MNIELVNSLISLVIIVIVALLLILEMQPSTVERIPVLSWWKRRR